MRLLLNSGIAKKVRYLLVEQNKFVCALLYIAGVVGIALFADVRVNQNTFVSENALLPGYVITKYQNQMMASQLEQQFSQLKGREERKRWIEGQFRKLRLEVYTQNFTVHRSLHGDMVRGENIYAVYRAPKAASAESIVFSTSLPGEGGPLQHAIPLMLSVAHLIAHQTIWAKDVIFLVSEEGEHGIGAWLNGYHDIPSPLISSSPILVHSGAIQAALHLDLPFYNFDLLRMQVEAINGQLPDIDLVVLVRQICRQERIELLLRDTAHNPGDFMGNLQGLYANMAWQAAGRIPSPNSLYHPFNIHAVGITSQKGTRRNRFSWQHIGRFSESVLRSVNNLEEQFHTAYYFYLLPCIERFVCLSIYMVPCGLLLASAAAKILGLWLTCGNVVNVDEKSIFYKDRVKNTIDCVYPFVYGLVYALSNEIISNFLSRDNILLILGASQVAIILSGLLFRQRADWRLHQAFVLLLYVLTVVFLCMLNISLTIFYAIPTTLAFLLQFPVSSKVVRVVQRALLLAVNPLVLVAVYSHLYTTLQMPDYQGSLFEDIAGVATSVVEGRHTFGLWTWIAYCYLLLPVWALQWTLILPSSSSPSLSAGEVKESAEKAKSE